MVFEDSRSRRDVTTGDFSSLLGEYDILRIMQTLVE